MQDNKYSEIETTDEIHCYGSLKDVFSLMPVAAVTFDLSTHGAIIRAPAGISRDYPWIIRLES